MIVCTNCLIDTHEREWVLRYNRTAVEFPKEDDVSRSYLRNSGDFSSPTWGRARTPTRGHDKNDTLTIQIMAQFTMVFTTRHRDEDAVERDCELICECIVEYSTRFEYTYNGKELLVFHVYGTDKKARIGILALILGHMHSVTDYKSLDLQSFTKD